MTDKEKHIIDTAMKLFAQKGYGATSVQDIATESGISKGAFYLHFKSKEALMIAIFKEHFQSIHEKVNAIEREEIAPRERFTKQLEVMFQSMYDHKDFIIMHAREQAIPLNEEVQQLMLKMRIQTYLFYKRGLQSVYGEMVIPYLGDLSIIMEGIYNAYSRFILFDKVSLRFHALAAFILTQVDFMLEGMTTNHIQAIINHERIESMYSLKYKEESQSKSLISEALDDIKKVLQQKAYSDDLSVSIELIETELLRPEPRPAVIKGMLSNFEGLPEFEVFTNKIISIFK